MPRRKSGFFIVLLVDLKGFFGVGGCVYLSNELTKKNPLVSLYLRRHKTLQKD